MGDTMKIFIFIAMFMILVIGVFGEDVSSNNESETNKNDIPSIWINVKYDRSKKRTTYSTVKIHLNEESKIFFKGIAYKKDGRKTLNPYISIISSSDKWRFSNHHKVILLVDGEIMKFPDAEHNGYANNDDVSEYINFFPTIEQMKKIANCKLFEAKVGKRVYSITYDELLPLRELFIEIEKANQKVIEIK